VAATRTFVIIGASLAGAKAAEALRQEGFDGRVVLVGEEPERPYQRPPLSKERLRGEGDPEEVYVHPEAYYAANDVDLRLSTRVTALHLDEHRVATAGGESIGFDRLLLATGSAPRRLSIPGADLSGVHYLRTLADAEDLRWDLIGAGRLAVIGAGWIGCEVAASARQLGLEVVMIDPLATPLERVLGPEVGAVYRDLHAAHGVELRLGAAVEALVGDGRVEGVRTGGGEVLPCDAVVAGIGAVPRTELAAAAGLAVDNGIVVDQYLAAGAPGVYAAGDVAAAWHPLFDRPVRVEHWANALHQGRVAALNMLGRPTVYDRVPYFYSDQYELGMEYAGLAHDWDRVVFRGDPASGAFVAFWLRDDRVLAGMNANLWDENPAIQDLVRSGRPVDVDRLTDQDLPLTQLAEVA
jgi:3-phenylpropionate/trans-cinnamate dioxygenase ferredoxin reductase subunit